jgi:hypothetical protein
LKKDLRSTSQVLKLTAKRLESARFLDRQTGRATQAETYFRDAVSIYGKTLGGEHPDYANALENLALTY